MKNKNTLLIALILLVVCATSIFVFAGGVKGSSGKSAYEIAVQNGYTGTETEWLTSLKGRDGQDAETIDYYELYNSAKTAGDIDESTSYLKFIEDYITANASQIQNNLLYSIQSSLRCSVGIFVFYSSNGYTTSNSAGAGTFIEVDANGSGKILTNYHVTYTGYSNTEYYVLLYEDNYILSQYIGQSSSITAQTIAAIKEKGIRASYIGGDKNYDLAVLQIEESDKLKTAYDNNMLSAAEFADGDDVYAGQTCYAIGNPMGEGISATQGVVSVTSENITIEDVENSTSTVIMRAMRTSCLINGGNSGGGVFNSDGKLIGVINSRRERVSSTNSSRVDGVSFAVPLWTAKNISKAILTQCDGVITTPTYHLMGISTTIDSCSSSYNESTGLVETIENVVVTSVIDNSPASLVDIAVGDVLRSFSVEYTDSTTTGIIEINHSYTLSEFVRTLSAGDKITLNYERNVGGTFQPLSVTITLV